MHYDQWLVAVQRVVILVFIGYINTSKVRMKFEMV